MERKCPNRLGTYLPFPEMTSLISMKIPGELLNRWSTKADRYSIILAHWHSLQWTGNNSTGHPRTAQDGVHLLQQRGNGAQTDLTREQCLPRWFCSLSGKQAQLAFHLIRSIFVHSKIKECFKVSLSKCNWCMQHNWEKTSRLSTAQLVTQVYLGFSASSISELSYFHSPMPFLLEKFTTWMQECIWSHNRS